jgi:hypothetical protein
MKLTDTQIRGLADIASQHGLTWFIKSGFNILVDNDPKNGLRAVRKPYKVNSTRELYEFIALGKIK